MKEFQEKLKFIRNSAHNGWCSISGIDLTRVMKIIKDQEEELVRLRLSQEPLPKGVITP